MPDGLLAAATELRAALADFDARLLSGVQCALVAEALAVTEKVCMAVRASAAARAIECGAHKDRGFSDGIAWVAKHAGTTSGAARQAVETAAALTSCPQANQALVVGEISLAQAAEIVSTDARVPGSATQLVELARTSGLAAVRERARDLRLAAEDPDELHRRQHRARRFRHWRDGQGMICFTGALAPEVGVPLVNRIDVETDRIRRQARRDGSTGQLDLREAHAADAVAAMLAGSGRGRSPRADMVVVCDLNAFRRGHTHPDEPCHIVGGGSIPVEVARAIARDAFLKVAFHDGVDIVKVSHLGRHIPAELRTALEIGDAPTFDGARCVDCGRRHGLEWDHVNPVNNQGPTSYRNLVARCWPDHQAKTERDRRAGLLRPRPP